MEFLIKNKIGLSINKPIVEYQFCSFLQIGTALIFSLAEFLSLLILSTLFFLLFFSKNIDKSLCFA
jgi:hypothetical protein